VRVCVRACVCAAFLFGTESNTQCFAFGSPCHAIAPSSLPRPFEHLCVSQFFDKAHFTRHDFLWPMQDSNCSSRFFDYGSEKMANAVLSEPQKAERWRTGEVAAANSFAAILACADEGMDTSQGGVAVSRDGVDSLDGLDHVMS